MGHAARLRLIHTSNIRASSPALNCTPRSHSNANGSSPQVIGCADFLVHHEFPLAAFDHIYTCHARCLPIKLILVVLSETGKPN